MSETQSCTHGCHWSASVPNWCLQTHTLPTELRKMCVCICLLLNPLCALAGARCEGWGRRLIDRSKSSGRPIHRRYTWDADLWLQYGRNESWAQEASRTNHWRALAKQAEWSPLLLTSCFPHCTNCWSRSGSDECQRRYAFRHALRRCRIDWNSARTNDLFLVEGRFRGSGWPTSSVSSWTLSSHWSRHHLCACNLRKRKCCSQRRGYARQSVELADPDFQLSWVPQFSASRL